MTEASDDDSGPVAASGPATEVTPKGPATAVIPKDAQPKGKKQRAQTFATNVQLEDMLSRATPLFPIEAIKDEPDVISSAEKPEDRRGVVAPALPVPGRNPPSRAALVVIGLGGLGLAAGALYVFYQGRSTILGQDAAADAPADARAIDASRDAAPDAAVDALIDATIDAAVVTKPDAAVRMTIDAAIATVPHDAAPADAAGTATLKVGADPWGNIVIDGKPYGQTPRTITVPAGHHTVEIVFPAETPPRKQTFAVDITAGETKPIQADFH
jgi:hypothetical protein